MYRCIPFFPVRISDVNLESKAIVNDVQVIKSSSSLTSPTHDCLFAACSSVHTTCSREGSPRLSEVLQICVGPQL